MPFIEDELDEFLAEEDPEGDWLENPDVPTSVLISELINCGFPIKKIKIQQYGGPQYSVWKLDLEDERIRNFVLDCDLRSEIRETDEKEYMFVYREIAVKMLNHEGVGRQCNIRTKSKR